MKRFDLQDALLLAGALSILAGVALWSVPAALVVNGLFCIAAVFGIERNKRRPEQAPKGTN